MGPDLSYTDGGRLGLRATVFPVVAANLLLFVACAACRRPQATTSSGRGSNPSVQTSAATTACVPGKVQPSMPAAVSAPIATAQGACSQSALDDLFGACFQRGGDCETWKAANRACSQCVFTPEGARQQGPFIARKNAPPKANQRGCLDRLAPGCGEAFEALDACTHAACGDDNPGCKGATPSQRAACRQAAMRTSCANLAQSFTDKCGVGGLVDKRLCFPPSSDETAMREFITRLARRACGSSSAPKQGQEH